MVKHDAEIFKMIMPQLDQMYQNCVMLRDTKSKKVTEAQSTIAQSRTKAPMAPVTIVRDKEDTINPANTKRGGKNTKGNGMKRKRGSG